PVAAAGRGKQAVGDVLACRRLLIAHFEFVGAAVVGLTLLRLLAAHLDVAAGRRVVFALLRRVVAAALLTLGFIAAFFGPFFGEVLGGRELEVFEQPSRQPGEGSLVVER